MKPTNFFRYRTTQLFVLGLVCCLPSIAAVAEPIPPERLPASGWTGNVGVPGGIPSYYRQYCNVRVGIPVPFWTTAQYYYYRNGYVRDPVTGSFFKCLNDRVHSDRTPHTDSENWVSCSAPRAVADGETDDAPAINCAVQNCPNNEFVYLPTGTYRINSSIYRKGGWNPFSIVIKGDGPQRTRILNYGPGNGIELSEYSEWNSRRMGITGGDVRGSKCLLLESVDVAIQPGLWMVVNRVNRAATSNADAQYMINCASQIVRVTSVDARAKVVGFSPALNEAFPGDYVSVGIGPPYRCGIEDLYVADMSNNGGNNILIDYGQECWVKNVESYNVSRWHIAFQDCAACEVRECVIHDGWSAGGNADYGVGLFQFCSQNLIEDNIFYHCRHAMEIEYGGQGNVFGYNADFDPVNSDKGPGLASELSTDYLMGDQLSHGGSIRWNLWEGNIAAIIRFDCVLGASSYNTAFRNQIRRKGLPSTIVGNFGSDIQKWNYFENISGNVYELQPRGARWPLRRWGTNQDSPVTRWRIIDVSATNPIEVTVENTGSNFSTGDRVTINGVIGIAEANVTSARITSRGDYQHFLIDGVAGSGMYRGGGVVEVGTDPKSEATALVDGEFDFDTNSISWAGTDHSLPNSYYLTARPSWFGDLPWPAVDPNRPAADGMRLNPAGKRFMAMAIDGYSRN